MVRLSKSDLTQKVKQPMVLDSLQQVRKCSLLIALILSSALQAGESLPNIEAVKRRIQQTESLIQNLQVNEKAVCRQRDLQGGDEIYEMDRECQWTITADGKKHYIATGETLRFMANSATTNPFKVELAFDGTYSRSLEYLSRDLARIFSGEVADHPSYYSMLPTEFTVLGGRESLLQILEKREYKVVGREEYQGREVLKIEGEAIERGGWFWNRRILFDMQRGTLVKTAYLMKQQAEKEWIEYAIWAGSNHEEISPGVWLPLKYRKYSFLVKKNDAPKEFSDGYVGTFSNWIVNAKLPKSRFQLIFPENVPVNDQRKGANGRLLSQAEIEELNRQQ
ncbi:LolA-like protein [Thalassoglobus polymorphus]|uniref:Outer membrane lipoprotein-sorting protein n=1 Tax=Thalassoglobus polymorphus TaxID=2527994 RepID=A0A517QMD6_9PLAN|nr:hypothetical protein [Thalassoglobus polymorphus]QDT32765.1 hypothetical protein Mal48_20120 [Thalassoglobus polymorphus]